MRQQRIDGATRGQQKRCNTGTRNCSASSTQMKLGHYYALVLIRNRLDEKVLFLAEHQRLLGQRRVLRARELQQFALRGVTSQ